MTARAAACWLALALPLAGAAAAQEPLPAWFLSPPALEPAFGDVVIEVELQLPEAREVRFLVDGREAGSARRPPYRLQVALGDNFGAHRFEAVILGRGGELARLVRETPALRVDDVVDLGLQQLYVTLDGAVPERPLTVEDFEVLDERRHQEIVTFEGGDAALTVAVLLDASHSMSGRALRTALDGARSLLEGLRRLDEAALLLFADAVLYRGPYSQDPAVLEGALASVRAAGGTALNDALYLALRQLEGRQGRRVVVLLSDGFDLHSVLGIEEVLWVFRRSRSVVYWIELPAPSSAGRIRSPWRSADEHQSERRGLRRLVVESGGRVVPISEVGEAAQAFASILEELRSQYVLGYYPSRDLDDGAWHQVAVRVRVPGIRARTRGGYIDD